MKTVCIAGLGLIGGSYAKALKKKGYRVLAIDKDPLVLDRARAEKIIDEGDTDPGKLLPEADLLVVCLYPGDTGAFIIQNQQHMGKGMLVTDASSVKTRIYNDLAGLREDIDFIGGHPMAGSQKKGYGHSRGDLFMGCNYIITITEKNKPENIMRIETLAKDVDAKNIIRATPEHHDMMVARTSHLPHILADCLKKTVEETGAGEYVGSSFRDMTRVADSNEELWEQIFRDNRENLLEAIKIFKNHLDGAEKSMEGENP
ncbi:MAG: prephenate dehydrogenase/arogenate dehydrogenase family protein [Clostridia bacterium]